MSDASATRRVLLSCLVIGVVLCICLSLVSLAGAGIIFFSATSNPTNIPAAASTPEDVDQQMLQIEVQVSDVRGLESKTSVIRQLLTPTDLRQHVLDNFLKDFSSEDARKDALALWAFGLLEQDFNLYDFYVELYSEQIAGYYDQETKEMFVVQGEGFLGPERLTYAHEFTHALQDQYYDIEKGLRYNDDDCEHESERCTALSALLEGDASLAESLWFSSHATLADQQQLSDFYSSYESPIYDSAPEFMKEDFLFPYQQGKVFVETLYDEGGWSAVDQAYLDPPVSSEQILHPGRYPDDTPAAIEIPLLPTHLGAGWEEIDRGVMGEWYSALILFAGLEPQGRIDRSQAEEAVSGWEGDAYVVFYNSSQSQTVMVLLTQWENPGEADEYQQAFQGYALQRFGQPSEAEQGQQSWDSDQGWHAFFRQGVITAWVLAPSASQAQTIWQSLPKQ